jgi:DNA-binding response OmpR family regulator
MFPTDSLINLRMNRKRTQPSDSSANTDFLKKSLPIEDLKAQAEKRLRTSSSLGGKTVSFNMLAHEVHHRHLSDEDLRNAWMSEKESDDVKSNAFRTVVAFRRGRMDHQKDCIRGLEVHVNPSMMKKKVKNGETCVGLILRQQNFPLSVMGTPNEQVLGRMSKMLSTEDVKEAQQVAALDEEEAALLHAVMKAKQEMKRRQKIADTLALALETSSLCTRKAGV